MMCFMLAALSTSCLPDTSNPRPLQQQQQQQQQRHIYTAHAGQYVNSTEHAQLLLNCLQNFK
jgi:hypothetical protein